MIAHFAAKGLTRVKDLLYRKLGYIGPSERSLGVTYVAISRVQKLSSRVIEPMTFERLAALKSSPKMQFRLRQEQG